MDEKKKEPQPHTAEALEHLEYTSKQIKEGLSRKRKERKAKEQANRDIDEYLAERIKKDAGQNLNTDIDEQQKPNFSPLFRDDDEIIDKGSLWEAVYLYIGNIDFNQSYGQRTLTKEQEKRITQRVLSSEKNRREASLYVNTYNAFLQYGKVLSVYRAEYQREAAKLTGLIDLMENLQAGKQALLNFFKLITSSPKCNTIGQGIDRLDERIYRLSDKVTISITTDGELDISQEEEETLLERIKEQSERTEEALRHLKDYIEPLSDYIYSDDEPPLWPLLPIRMENILEYPDFIPEQQEPHYEKYFRFRLRQRREKGETITPEEEAIAYYPDYNKLEENKEEVEQAKSQILQIFKLWEVSHRPNKRKR